MRFNTWFKYAAATLLVAILSIEASAQSEFIVRWTFETTGPAIASGGTDETISGPWTPEIQRNNSWAGSAVGVHSDATTDYSSPAGDGSLESFSANTWNVNDYWQFHTNSLGLSNIGLGFDTVSSNSGPRDFKVAYSTDGTNYTDSAYTYQVRANSGDTWGSASRDGLDVHTFDFTGITALNNQPSIYFRLIDTSTTSANGGTVSNVGVNSGTNRVDNVTIMHNFDPLDPFPPVDPPVPPAPEGPGLYPQPKDVVIGHSTSFLTTFDLVRGSLAPNGGAAVQEPWYQNAAIQSVEFDNYDGQTHNAHGNLLGVNFNEGGLGSGTVYSFATQETDSNGLAPVGQLIASTAVGHASHGGNVAATRLTGISVSPDNSKIAMIGYDLGTVIVFDYNDGDTMGAGASASNGRDTDPAVTSGRTQGTAWKDDNTVLAFTMDGDVISVNATTMAFNFEETISIPSHTSSEFADIEFNSEISNQYVIASYGGFTSDDPLTPDPPADPIFDSRLYIFDANNGYALVNEVDLEGDFGDDSVREIAFDQEGNLFLSAANGKVFYIPDVLADPANLADNSAELWFDSATNSLFNGMDVAWGEITAVPGDHDGDLDVDINDYVTWRANEADNGGPTGYDAWAANYGYPPGFGSAAGSAVPEPASLALLAIGVAAAFCGRRR